MKPNASLHQIPLTIFELVESKSLHWLYGMLAVALDQYTVIEDDTSSEDAPKSYLSIILPAKQFRHSDTRYEITVSPIYLCYRFNTRSLCGADRTLLPVCLYRLYSWTISFQEKGASLGGSSQCHLCTDVSAFRPMTTSKAQTHVQMTCILVYHPRICYLAVLSIVLTTALYVVFYVRSKLNHILSSLVNSRT